MGLGAGLALRAAAFERRIAALVLGPGICDQALGQELYSCMHSISSFVGTGNTSSPELDDNCQSLQNVPVAYQTLGVMLWVHGSKSIKELAGDLSRFDVKSYLSEMTVPTLLSGHPTFPLLDVWNEIHRAFPCTPTMIGHSPASMSEGETILGTPSNQRIFDWLDQTLADEFQSKKRSRFGV